MFDRRSVLCALAASLALPSAALAQALPFLGQGVDGRPLASDTAPGWKLVYFGYTHCPDVCPMGLQSISEALNALGPIGERITPVFVTVDPERDTPPTMKDYLGFFHPRFVGIIPNAEQLAEMAKAWRVRYAKAASATGGAYTVDHTASIFFVQPSGTIIGRFPHDLDREQLANKIKAAMLAQR